MAVLKNPNSVITITVDKNCGIATINIGQFADYELVPLKK
jgi:hypothetical protein